MVEMGADDQVLQLILSDLLDSETNELSLLVPAEYLRHEHQYNMFAMVTNGEVRSYKDLIFIPNMCRWFDVVDSDAYSTYKEIEQLPGYEDITFYLELKQSQLNCSADFLYFSELTTITHKFMTNEGYYKHQPSIEWF